MFKSKNKGMEIYVYSNGDILDLTQVLEEHEIIERKKRFLDVSHFHVRF